MSTFRKLLIVAAIATLSRNSRSPRHRRNLTFARFYRAEGNGLDAQAARYEDAAANLWEGPVVKNLTSPTTAGQFEFAAKRFRDEAKADRAVAASHEEMAKTAAASLN